jgi:phosphoglycolate phosphatase
VSGSVEQTSNGKDTQVYVQPGFAWDAQDAYLFDIDGTLLRSTDRVHYQAFFDAVTHALGEPLSLDGVVLHGNTDPGILRDAFRLRGTPDSHWRPHVEEIFAHMRAAVERQKCDLRSVVMPGVEAVLRHLKKRGARLGVATGNIETIGWLKVETAGLRDWFGFGGFSDRFEVRAAMIAHALELARGGMNERGDASARVCVVGDTPFDITAARANGLPTIAVATGHYSFEQLMEHAPEACAVTLEALFATLPVAQRPGHGSNLGGGC